MKGLFVKDLCYFKELIKTLVIFLLIASMVILFQNFKYEKLIFVSSYMIVCGTMMAVNLIAYDQDQNGMSFLMTFPINRKDYVREKYLFSGFVLLVILVIMSVLSVISIACKHAVVDYSDLLLSSGIAMCVAVLMMSIMIPLKLKFEEKGNLVMVVTVFAVVAIVYIMSKGTKFLPHNIEMDGSFIATHYVEMFVAGIVVTILAVIGSMKISENILGTKEY